MYFFHIVVNKTFACIQLILKTTLLFFGCLKIFLKIFFFIPPALSRKSSNLPWTTFSIRIFIQSNSWVKPSLWLLNCTFSCQTFSFSLCRSSLSLICVFKAFLASSSSSLTLINWSVLSYWSKLCTKMVKKYLKSLWYFKGMSCIIQIFLYFLHVVFQVIVAVLELFIFTS